MVANSNQQVPPTAPKHHVSTTLYIVQINETKAYIINYNHKYSTLSLPELWMVKDWNQAVL